MAKEPMTIDRGWSKADAIMRSVLNLGTPQPNRD